MDPAQHVAAAEEHARAVFPLRRFRRFSEIEDYIEALVSRPWWSTRFGDAPLEILVQRRSRAATFSAAGLADTGLVIDGCQVDPPGLIWLVDGHGWGLDTVLHELAHLAAGPTAGHGPGFRDALCALWRHEAGIVAWAALRAGFAAGGVNAFDHPTGEQRGGFPRPQPHP